MIQNRNATHVTDHVCISNCDAHLGLTNLAVKLGGVVILGIRRNLACVLQEEPAVTDGVIVLFTAKAICFAAGSVTGDIGAKCTGIIQIVGAVTLSVLVGHKVVRDGLNDIFTHFAVKIGDKAVRQVVVGRCQHLVRILDGGKQSVDGCTGGFRGLTQTSITEFEAFA